MPEARTVTVGTLGGPGTFAGQAAEVACDRFPELGEIVYFPSMADAWAAIKEGTVDNGFLGSETTHTGFGEMAEMLLDPARPLYVIGEVIVPYNCLLLGKPGARMDQIRLVLGHGSVLQCSPFLAERLPAAAVRIHRLNSVAAAQEVTESDGSVAVVATEHTARATGLTVLEPGIDRGSSAAWWILSPKLAVSPAPDTVVVSVRAKQPGAVETVFAKTSNLGLVMRSIASVNRHSLFAYNYVVVLRGSTRAEDAFARLSGIPGIRVIGAFDSAARALPSQPAPDVRKLWFVSC